MAFDTTEQQIVDFFIASYGRVPAQSGLDFFRTQIDSHTISSDDVINYMMSNEEAMNRYASIDSLEEKVNIVFNNVLGRDVASQEGMVFWSSKFNDKSYTMATLVKDVIDIAKTATDSSIDAQTLINKSMVAEYFLEHVPVDNQAGKQIYLDSITADSSSVLTVEKEIDNMATSSGSKSYVNDALGELSNAQSEGVSALDSGTHWNQKEITYSFNQSIPDSYRSETDEELTQNWAPLTTEQKNASISIIEEISHLLDIKLTKVEDGGDIRFNIVDMDEGTSGFAFYPSPDYGGDLFLSQAFNTDPKNYGLHQGEDGWTTITHELGHALGLKHPFDGEITLPSNLDNTNHTIMSYTYEEDRVVEFTVETSSIHASVTSINPSLYSLYDVSALQSIYGVNRSYHTEDNVYTTAYDDYNIQTIWDAGGKDTIDLSSNQGSTTIDLHGGTL
ncbi:MAG: hypothetical protein DSZ11_04340, partial [Sulfurovum sp.]